MKIQKQAKLKNLKLEFEDKDYKLDVSLKSDAYRQNLGNICRFQIKYKKYILK